MNEASFIVDANFSKWASGYAGMSGGNPKSDLWFCGIEYGGDHNSEEIITNTYGYLDVSDTGIPSWGEKFIEAHRTECTKWQYIQKIAKLACLYEGKDKNTYADYILNKLCRSDGATFLMNLYPFNFPTTCHTHWKEGIFKRTGLPNKELYIAWCMQNRFPRLAKLVREYAPKIVICTGSSFKSHFQLAFLDKEQIYQEGVEIEFNKKKCFLFAVLGTRTKILVTPFFGQGGIMADTDLVKLAEIVKNIEGQ